MQPLPPNGPSGHDGMTDTLLSFVASYGVWVVFLLGLYLVPCRADPDRSGDAVSWRFRAASGDLNIATVFAASLRRGNSWRPDLAFRWVALGRHQDTRSPRTIQSGACPSDARADTHPARWGRRRCFLQHMAVRPAWTLGQFRRRGEPPFLAAFHDRRRRRES